MYAIVRCGGRQEKVAVDDVLAVDKVVGEVGSTVKLPAVLVVDGGEVVSDPGQLAAFEVTAEILGESKGPKLSIMKYKNKTGYKRRLGHRQGYTQVKVIDIAGAGKSAAKQRAATETTGETTEAAAGKTSTKKAAAKKSPARATATKTAAAKPKAAAKTSAAAKTAKTATATAKPKAAAKPKPKADKTEATGKAAKTEKPAEGKAKEG